MIDRITFIIYYWGIFSLYAAAFLSILIPVMVGLFRNGAEKARRKRGL